MKTSPQDPGEILEVVNSIVLRWDPSGVIRSINRFGLEFFGYSAEDLIGANVRILLPPIERSTGRDLEALVRAIARDPDRFKVVPSENVTKDGQSVWVIWTNSAICDDQGRVQEILAVGNDITQLKQLEDELRLSEERYRMLNRAMVQPVALHEIICDSAGVPVDYRFLDVNPAFEKLLGMEAEDIIGKTVMEILPQTERSWVETYGRVALTGESVHFENRADSLDRHFEVVAYSPRAGQFAVIAMDITERIKMYEERRRIEEKMYKAQKLESLGVLAGGIAHDFNNILMAILGNAELAMMRLHPEDPVLPNLRDIETAARKAADLAGQMLAYSGRRHVSVARVSLNRIVEEMLEILRVSISKSALLRVDNSPLGPVIEADVAQLEQVIMNLVINASEAIGERSGVIAISTGSMECDRSYLEGTSVDEGLAGGSYAYLEVTDTGCGMEKERLEQIFDPFFSTKFTGRGLGLAAVQGIIRGHKGTLEVSSEVGKGTTFKILLPSVDGPEDADERESSASNWKGEGTVLLVDDEETVRAVASQMIESFGFDVLTAGDGAEAVRIFQEHRGRIVCVVMDLTMPHMDGAAAFRELRRVDLEVPIVMSSGYGQSDVPRELVGRGLSAFIQKPYRVAALRDCLREALESRSPTG